jgi:MbtH protein
MSTPAETYLNPFDDERHNFSVLVNSRHEYSLWPEFADLPPGWTRCFGPAAREACLDYVECHWPAINPFAPAPAAGALA